MPDPGDPFTLSKTVWTQDDFERMNWHDVTIHAMAFHERERELVFDIDYIFEWVNPEPPAQYFSFWIAPATLVFHDVWSLKVSLQGEPHIGSFGMEISGIQREGLPVAPHIDIGTREWIWNWNIGLLLGSMSFQSQGYSQYTRRKPVCRDVQVLELSERGGISFERIDAKPDKLTIPS
ncbi:MAG TPA: hypothetical protein VIM58_13295 [Candidatus Methylacidiphilales bacterium]